MYEYSATLTRIVDGDTLDFSVDLGFKIKQEIRIRLLGIDTPETYRPKSPAEKVHGMEAVAFIEKIMPIGSSCKLKTYKDKTGKYGRYLADVVFENTNIYGPVAGVDISLVSKLISNGFEKKDSYST